MNDSIVCVDCHEEIVEVFTWSCGHLYHAECAKSRINDSLSNDNSIPKCVYPDCNRSLTINNKQKYDPSKIQAILPEKYKGGKNMFNYDKNECLIYGFIKQILYLNTSNHILVPTEIILLIFDYYCLNYFKQVTCFLCLGTGNYSGPKEEKCTKCVDGRSVIKCNNCNGRGTKTSYSYSSRRHRRYVSDKCKVCYGTGDLDCGNCRSCCGHGIIRHKYKYCWECNGKKHLISIDFNKLCQKQALCLECSYYFPMDKIHHWNRCHHTYCPSCVDTLVKKQIIKSENPHCPMKSCKFKEKLQSNWNKTRCARYHRGGRCECKKYYKTYSEVKSYHYCGLLNENYGVFVWSNCRHVFCKSCIALDIRDDLIKLKIPKCPLTMLHKQHENLLSIKDLKKLEPYFRTRSDGFDFVHCCKQLRSRYVYCKICNQRHDKDDIFLWSKCRHKYGIKCMKQYINGKRVVITNGLLCIENKNNVTQKVVCFNNKCNEILSVADYKQNNFGRVHVAKQ